MKIIELLTNYTLVVKFNVTCVMQETLVTLAATSMNALMNTGKNKIKRRYMIKNSHQSVNII